MKPEDVRHLHEMLDRCIAEQQSMSIEYISASLALVGKPHFVASRGRLRDDNDWSMWWAEKTEGAVIYDEEEIPRVKSS